MTGELTDNLSKKRIQQLLAAVGSAPDTDTAQIEFSEYDFHEPHYFNSEQLERLQEFAKQAATGLAQKFVHFFRSDFNVTIGAIKQHFAGEFGEQLQSKGQKDRYLTFGPDQGHPCGFICIPEQTTLTWLSLLLGDSESERKTDSTLSRLEESLLLDVTLAIVEAFCYCLRNHAREELPNSHGFHPAANFTTEASPLGLYDVEELCQIVLTTEGAESSKGFDVYFVMPCATLAPIVGKKLQNDAQISKKDNSKAISQHLQQIPITIFVKLASVPLTFEEAASLQPSDILLLDKPIEEPLELVIENRTVFRGRPVKSSGQRAVIITESCCENTDSANSFQTSSTV
jgi:flagellar motor switch protein FliM